MRISASPNYYHDFDCLLDDCRRQYCPDHRLLYRDCESVTPGMDDVYINGRPHYLFEMGECPACVRQRRDRAFATFFTRMLPEPITKGGR